MFNAETGLNENPKEFVMNKLVLLGAVVPAVVVIAACQTDPRKLDDTASPAAKAAAPAGDFLSAIEGDWELENLAGTDISALKAKLPEGVPLKLPNLSFKKDGAISGFSGVNRIFGKTDPAQLAKGNLDLSKMGSTMMAGMPGMDELERGFMSALRQANVAKIDGAGKLALSNGGSPLVTFKRAK